MEVVDALNPLVGKTPLDEITKDLDIVTFNIILPNNNLKLLKIYKSNAKNPSSDLLHAKDKSLDNNDYIKTSIKINNEIYQAKIKFHALSGVADKSSYRIKFDKDKLYDGMKTISLLDLNRFNAPMAYSYYLQEKYLGLKVINKFARVKINGLDQGIYRFEERLGKELLEKNNLSGVDIIKFNNTWDHQYEDNHNHPFVYSQPSIEFDNISNIDIGQKYILGKILNQKNNNIFKYIDKDYWARYMAILAIYGDHRSIYGDNAKYMYNTANGKIYPFLRTEFHLHELITTDNFSFDQALYNASLDNNQKIKRFYSGLFVDLIQDNELRALRNKYLYQFVTDRKKILEMYDEINEKMLQITDVDPSNVGPTRFYRIVAGTKRAYLESNLDTIERYLSYSKVYVNLHRYNQNSYLLEIEADTNSPVKINNISLDTNLTKELYIKENDTNIASLVGINNLTNYFTRHMFQLELDHTASTTPTKKSFLLYTEDDKFEINDLQISFVNTITKKEVPKNKVLISTSDYPLQYFEYDFNSIIAQYKNIEFNSNTKQYVFKPGEYRIYDNLIFPYGSKVVIREGVRIYLSENKSILVYGDLNINGTKDNKVIISNLTKNKPFGVVASIGDNNTNTTINYLEIYGGKDAILNGSFFSGALSLYSNNNVEIMNSYIHHNNGDDGLNIKNSNVMIENNIFNANSADQIDLDYGTGHINNNSFIFNSITKNYSLVHISKDDNGDGLDLSGSEIIVQENSFDGFPDKGISVGERTLALVSNNNFLNNKSAITAKDQSKVYLYKNIYKNNKISIEMYQKKKVFKHPSVFNINEKHQADKIMKTNGSHYYKYSDTLNIDDVLSIKDLGQDIFRELNEMMWVEYE